MVYVQVVGMAIGSQALLAPEQRAQQLERHQILIRRLTLHRMVPAQDLAEQEVAERAAAQAASELSAARPMAPEHVALSWGSPTLE